LRSGARARADLRSRKIEEVTAMSDVETMSPLTDEACWAVLGRNEFGHLAFSAAGETGIAPVNYLAQEGRLLFRTAEGSKLMAITMNESVAFEVDEIGQDEATSVIVHGRAIRLTEREEDALDQELRPWVATLKYNVVAIEPTEVTGRSFRLER